MKHLLKGKKQLIALGVAVLLLVSLVLEIGQRFPQTGFPSWDTAFGTVGDTPAVDGSELEVHFVDVGNADCIFIRQGEATMLIDAGEKGDKDTIIQYLQRQGVTSFDYVISTHFHADHIGSMPMVIQKFSIKEFLWATMSEEKTPTSAIYMDMLMALDEKKVPVSEAEVGGTYSLGSASFKVIAPLDEDADENNRSVAVLLTYGEKRFLLMGDAESSTEKLIMKKFTLPQVDVLKTGHHGSRTASTTAFLKQIKPAYAVITCGMGNSYGHPHKEALQRLKKIGAQIVRSDTLGTMVFKTDGKDLTFTSEKGDNS